MPPIKRLISLVFALALVVLGVVDVIYLLFYAKEITVGLVVSAALTLGLGGFWLYSDFAAAKQKREE